MNYDELNWEVVQTLAFAARDSIPEMKLLVEKTNRGRVSNSVGNGILEDPKIVEVRLNG